jgi:hypothetical protein
MSENELERLSKALRDAQRKLADVQEALESETNEARAIGSELRLLQVSVSSGNFGLPRGAQALAAASSVFPLSKRLSSAPALCSELR